jgi:transcriptional regulator with XRE-family HTH domain
MEPTTEIIHLDLEEIRRDGGTQPRAKIDLQHIKRLEEQIEDGQEIEPVVVFFDGDDYWLADGFHRWNAHRNQEEPTIRAIIYHGTRREAVLYSVGANADHKPALPRSRADKRKVVLTLLNDPEWKQWSDREIARQCKVDHKTVGKIRKSLTGDFPSNKSLQSLTGDFPSDPSTSLTAEVRSEDLEEINEHLRTYRTKHGTIATMNTTNIGKTSEEDLNNRIKVTTDEILIAFLSNLEYMSPEQVKAALKAIASSHPDIIKNLHITD